MENLLILLLFPLAFPFIAKRIWHTTINWTEMVIQIIGVSVLVTIVWQLGIYGQTVDVEVWNGKVTKKEVNDGHYLQSYSCNCRTVSCGKDCSTTQCDTCYEDHYTRSYDGYSTVGDWTFDSIDTTSKLRRDSFGPPASYTNCVVGEPASRAHTYTNYVQAVPESLFHDDGAINTYADMVPAQPKVHGFYKFNRVMQVGVNYPHAKQLNDLLNDALKTLGPSKQVNPLVLITNITDPSYRYAVERKWLGGEKNEATLFIGVDGTKIIWVDVMTWALNKGNELFHVKLRDSVKALGTIDDPNVLSAIVVEHIETLYDRPHMKDFEYLAEAVEPPTWVIILSIILAIGGSIGASFAFHKYEVEDVIGDFFSGKRKFRRYR
jgi:hypothetical protein